MKKIVIIVLLGLMQSFNLRAQYVEEDLGTDNEGFGKGTSLVDVYYGFPNFYAYIFKAENVSTSATNVTISGIGPIGGKYEYLLTDMFGISGEFNYSSFKLSYAEQSYDINNNPITHHYTYTSPASRALLGFNFHFLDSESFDFYAAFKGGYYNRTFSYSSDDPIFKGTTSIIIPVAIRLETGFRYFFTDFLGVNVQLGVGGGPLIAAGLSGKF